MEGLSAHPYHHYLGYQNTTTAWAVVLLTCKLAKRAACRPANNSVGVTVQVTYFRLLVAALLRSDCREWVGWVGCLRRRALQRNIRVEDPLFRPALSPTPWLVLRYCACVIIIVVCYCGGGGSGGRKRIMCVRCLLRHGEGRGKEVRGRIRDR